MIFGELSKKLYAYIIQAELMFLRLFKIDPFSMIQNMSLLDLEGLIKGIEAQNKRDSENKQGDKLMKSLASIRDILNYMALPS